MNKHSRNLTGRHQSKITEEQYENLIHYLAGDINLTGKTWLENALRSHILNMPGTHDLVALNRAILKALT